MKKKITAIIVCAAVLSLSACGTNNESGNPAASVSTTDSAESSKTESSTTVSSGTESKSEESSTKNTSDNKPDLSDTSSTENSAPEESSSAAPHIADEADFETEAVEGGVSITKYIGSDTNVIIPDTIGGEKVVMLGGKAFYDNDNIQSVTIPDSVVSIGENEEQNDSETFRDCSNLAEVTFLGDDMPSFQRFTFYSTPWWNTKEAENPDYTIINNMLVVWNYKYEGIAVIPDNVTKIAPYAFCGTNATEIAIPDSVTEIGDGAFSYMEKITEITIPDNVMEIGKRIFYSSLELKKVTLSKNITKIPEEAFRWCVNLDGIEIPDGVTVIERGAFTATTAGRGINIPDSVKEIHNSVEDSITDFTYKGKTYKSMSSMDSEFYMDFDGTLDY